MLSIPLEGDCVGKEGYGTVGEAMQYFSEKELIQKAKQGDKAAFKELFEKHHGKVLGYLYRYMSDFQKAEDVAVQTFLEVYKRLSSYKEKGKFLPWVFKIATNFAKKQFRKKKRLREVSLDKPVDEDGVIGIGDLVADHKYRPDKAAARQDLNEFIEKIIGSLDEKYRAVLILCDIEGLSYEEAARALKSNKATVGMRLLRGRKLLYKALKSYGYKFQR